MTALRALLFVLHPDPKKWRWLRNNRNKYTFDFHVHSTACIVLDLRDEIDVYKIRRIKVNISILFVQQSTNDSHVKVERIIILYLHPLRQQIYCGAATSSCNWILVLIRIHQPSELYSCNGTCELCTDRVHRTLFIESPHDYNVV